MKTFFDITINCNGQCENIRIQSTKLRKYSETRKCGIYKPKQTITIGIYQIDIYLFLTHRVELCGTCGKPIKQKRYTLHKHDYEAYMVTEAGLLINVFPEIAKIHVVPIENDFVDDGVVILDNVK